MHDTLMQFWAEAINTTCYTTYRVFLRPGTKKTSYELWIGRKPNPKQFKTFSSDFYILKDGENLGKFNSNQNIKVIPKSSNVVVNDYGYDQEMVDYKV